MGEDVVIEVDGVWKVFGRQAPAAFAAIIKEGLTKPEVLKRFGCVVGVKDASFSVRQGEIFCIMGLSGSGKSTLVRHVNRLIEPTAGRIRINGQDVGSLEPEALRAMRAGEDRHGVPEHGAAAAPHGARQRRLRAGTARRRPVQAPVAGRRDDRPAST
jgi:glycine betaine/proline transport system ATP-binding protein